MGRKITKIIMDDGSFRRRAIFENDSIEIVQEINDGEGGWDCHDSKMLYPNEIYAVVDILFDIMENPDGCEGFMHKVVERVKSARS